MHSTYTDRDGKRHSKIVPMLTPGAAVTTSRNDVDYVVTEYGIAWLRGLTIAERVQALIKSPTQTSEPGCWRKQRRIISGDLPLYTKTRPGASAPGLVYKRE